MKTPSPCLYPKLGSNNRTYKMKTIVVSGASRGIGFELTRLAQKQGLHVIALSRNTVPLQELGVTVFSVDLSQPKSLSSYVEYLKKENICVDFLVNNAGYLKQTPFSESDWGVFESVYRVNVFGLAELTRATLPFISSTGHVLSITSMGGIQGSSKFPGLAAYSSSKGAVITLTELLAEEYNETGPAFNALALGAVQTEMLEEAFPGYQAPISAIQMGEYILDFACRGHELYNGKVLPVAKSTP